MRALRVVLTVPAFDEDLGFMQRIEELPVQQLIPQLPVKGLNSLQKGWSQTRNDLSTN